MNPDEPDVSKLRASQRRRRLRDARITVPLQSKIAELRAALTKIQEYCDAREDLSWEDHGDEFREVAEMAKEALA